MEHPILFRDDMVRAILAGVKTRTMRTRGLEFVNSDGGMQSAYRSGDGGWVFWSGPERSGKEDFTRRAYPTGGFRCPYGNAGDTLWVRECWVRGRTFSNGIEYLYRADTYASPRSDISWRPSIHMPRVACRLKLSVIESKPQRLLDISTTQALEEGITFSSHYLGQPDASPRDALLSLWDEINAKRGYKAATNPWVWAVTFKVLSQ